MTDLSSLVSLPLVVALVTTSVAALRKRVPAIDGWWVLLVAALFSVAYSALAITPWVSGAWVEAITTALMGWVSAVGGVSVVQQLLAIVRPERPIEIKVDSNGT
jgi:hypothetical protein